MRHLSVGFVLPGDVLDAEYDRLGHVLLALEAPWHLVWQRVSVQRKLNLLDGLAARLPLAVLRGDH